MTITPRIRSFVHRQGRITAAQQQALREHWPRYGLEPAQQLDIAEHFTRDAPLILEIGFGNGECLARMAAAQPELNFLGVEVHKPGIGHLLNLLVQQQLNNVRIYSHDALDILEHNIADHSLSGVHLFFPDPWHKKKHHKRRIVRAELVRLLERKLAQGGYIHAATDWQDYAEAMVQEFSKSPLLHNTSNNGDYCPRPAYRPLTKFEQRGLRLGHEVWDLIFQKK